ncbi:MAG: outer membrane protein assembly factor BamE [Rhodobacteraceae bacterium]|nr:outer membrane protein assembly factor BamE [Paracoccaceae bacterium]
MRTSAAKAIWAVALLTLLAGCVAQFRNHGYVPPDDVLAQVAVGRDTRATVAEKIGAPGSSGVLDEGGYYYVKSRFRHYAWQAPEEISREVVAITFSRGGVVTNITRYGLEDGRVVALSRRVTDSNTDDISLLRQIFGNFGRLDAGQFLGGEQGL